MISARILLADDEATIREMLGSVLQAFGHEVRAVTNGREILETVSEAFDVIILDINMPVMNGFETLKALNQLKLEIPVLFLTGAGSMENAMRSLKLGAYDFINKPVLDLHLFNLQIHRALEKRRYVLRERAYTRELEAEVEAKTRELLEKNALLAEYSRHLENATLNLILSLQTAMEEKDGYTAGHTCRVTQYALMIGQEMELTGGEMLVLERAAQLHDIGKLVLDTGCIEKAGPLTMEEWAKVRQHPLVGGNIIRHLGFLEQEGDIIRSHHERLDGRGYPYGRCAGEVGLLTRIVTVADSFDAMTSRRSYRNNLSKSDATAELHRCAGRQFDPEVVAVFASVLAAITAETLPIE